MKRKFIVTAILLSFLFSGNSQESKTANLAVIDVERGLKNLSRLKISDLGKTIRYIPLETTDEGLIGRNTVVKVLKNYIVVEHRPTPRIDPGVCLLFSKEDGRFITTVGHKGQDPMAYTDCFSWTDEKEEFLYFQRMPDQLVKYDMKGNYCGKIELSSSGLPSSYLITDSQIIGFFDDERRLGQGSEQYALGIFEKNGILKDKVPSFFQSVNPHTDDLYQTDLLNGATFYRYYGSWIRNGVIKFTYTPAIHVRQIWALNAQTIWKSNDNIRFKQDFVDTVYTVSGSKLIPSYAFNTGKFHWPLQERRNERNNRDRIFISDISENSSFLFFQCIRGMFSWPVLYNGLYNKKTGETKLGLNSDTIEDDLTRFMPFKPLGMSTTGEFVSFIEVWEVMEWLEKHPEAKNNEKLSFLKDLDEEANPIVILVE